MLLEFIILIVLLIALTGFLGGDVVIKHDNKETNLNDKLNEAVDKVKEKIEDKIDDDENKKE